MTRSCSILVALVFAFALASPTLGSSPDAAAATSPVTWRVKVALDYFFHDPGIGQDGTIYIPNHLGTQAVNPVDGSTKWIAPYGGGSTSIAVGTDGVVYVAGGGAGTVGGTDSISALRPDGTLKWMFAATGDGIIAGPSVGPDGNLYAVTDLDGIGFFSITPTGQIRFATGQFHDYGPLGMNIAFGPDRAYFGFDMYGVAPSALFAYDLNGGLRWSVGSAGDPPSPAVGPNGNVVFLAFPSNVGKSVWAYSPAGLPVYQFYEFPGNEQSALDVGPDNVAYVSRNLNTLVALNPGGAIRWRSTATGILFDPRVNKQNTVVISGGRTAYGEPGFFRAVRTTGQELFNVALPVEPGFEPYGQLIPTSRPVFSPDGSTAYAVTDVAGDGNVPYLETYAYLYAINTTLGDAPTPPAAPTNLAGLARSATQVDLTWTDGSTNETGFLIQRCRGAGCKSFVSIATVGTNVARFSDRSVSGPGTFRYRVRAFNSAGNSAWSNRIKIVIR